MAQLLLDPYPFNDVVIGRYIQMTKHEFITDVLGDLVSYRTYGMDDTEFCRLLCLASNNWKHARRVCDITVRCLDASDYSYLYVIQLGANQELITTPAPIIGIARSQKDWCVWHKGIPLAVDMSYNCNSPWYSMDYAGLERAILLPPVFQALFIILEQHVCAPTYKKTYRPCFKNNQGGRRNLMSWETIKARHEICEYIYMLNTKIGLTDQWALGLKALAAQSDNVFTLMKCFGVFSPTTSDEWLTKMKNLTVVIKSLYVYLPKSVKLLTELQVLKSRDASTIEIDWHGEMNLRQQYINKAYTQQQLYEVLIDMFRTVRRRNAPISLNTYIESLLLTTPSGHGFIPDIWDQKETGIEGADKSRKMIVLAQYTHDEIRNMMLNQNEIYVKTHPKIEWGKARPLYATDIISTIQCDFVAPNIEELMPDIVVSGSQANIAKLPGVLRYFFNNFKYEVGLDYDSFNEQHNIEDMQTVMRAFGDSFSAMLSMDQRYMLEKCIDNMTRIRCNYRQIEMSAEVTSTLMSGMRWTTFINSMLNAAYFKLASKGLACVAKVCGDDSLVFSNSLNDIYALRTRLQEMGLKIQNQKSHLNAGGEFLRYQIIPREQYLCRSLATMITTRWETERSEDTIDGAAAAYRRLHEYVSRGGSMDLIDFHNYISTAVNMRGQTEYICVDVFNGGFVDRNTQMGQYWIDRCRELGIRYIKYGLLTCDIANGTIADKLNTTPGINELKYVLMRDGIDQQDRNLLLRHVYKRACVQARKQYKILPYTEVALHLRHYIMQDYVTDERDYSKKSRILSTIANLRDARLRSQLIRIAATAI